MDHLFASELAYLKGSRALKNEKSLRQWRERNISKFISVLLGLGVVGLTATLHT